MECFEQGINTKSYDSATKYSKSLTCISKQINNLSDKTSLLAVQGPKAELLCESFTKEDLKSLSNYSFILGKFEDNKSPFRII